MQKQKFFLWVARVKSTRPRLSVQTYLTRLSIDMIYWLCLVCLFVCVCASLTQDISAPKHRRPDTCSDHISSLCVPDSKKPALIWSLKVKIYYTNIAQISLSNLDKTWCTVFGTVFWCLNKLHHWLDGVRMIKGWHFNRRWRHFIFTSRLLLCCCCHAQTAIFIFLYLYFLLFWGIIARYGKKKCANWGYAALKMLSLQACIHKS